MVNVWTHGRNLPYRDVIREYVEQVRQAEKAGFTGAWVGEHHFQEEGFDVLPNPTLLATHIAAHTESIRIGLGAVTLPAWNPLRAAEDIASLDHYSDGRVDCAFSRGIDPRDIVHLNPDADRSNEKASLQLFVESLDIVEKAWTTSDLNYSGEHFSYPRPGLKVRPMPWHERSSSVVDADGTQIALDVLPKPLQSPHPPLHLVTESPGGVSLAAARDMGVITWLPSGDRLRQLFATYARASEEAGRPVRPGERTAILRPCFVAESMKEARAKTEAAANRMGGAMTGGPRGRTAFYSSADDVDNGEDMFDFLLARDHLLIGTPESVRDQMIRLRDEYDVNHILCWTPFYGVSHEDALSSIRLFAEEIAPKLAY
nr:LLM class flavin-dependent oxidoreductase [Gordonia sp. SID5947]